MDTKQPRLLEQLVDELRKKHYSRDTERSYARWVIRFVRFHNLRHPKDMGASEVSAFLSYLAVERGVAASTQNQALNALVFLYRYVVNGELDDFSLEVLSPNNGSNKIQEIINTVEHDKKSRTGVIVKEYQINKIPKKGNDLNLFGTGTWSIKISCNNATGIEYSCDCPSAERVEDNGNAWTLVIEGRYYQKK